MKGLIEDNRWYYLIGAIKVSYNQMLLYLNLICAPFERLYTDRCNVLLGLLYFLANQMLHKSYNSRKYWSLCNLSWFCTLSHTGPYTASGIGLYSLYARDKKVKQVASLSYLMLNLFEKNKSHPFLAKCYIRCWAEYFTL